MRKLTVKNFSVIKEAELEFGKITVLIGPQSSGKSLLCKLAYFFSQYLPQFANSVARRHPSFKELSDTIQRRFADLFPAGILMNQRARIDYTSTSYSVSVSVEPLAGEPNFQFSSDFPSDYDSWKARDLTATEVTLGDDLIRGPYNPSGSVYIPSGRNFFSTPNKGILSVSSKQLDWITQRFSTEIDFEYRAMIASSIGGADLLGEFGRQSKNILLGHVVSANGGPHFQQISDRSILPFERLSAGTLELLPLLNPLGKLTADASLPNFIRDSELSRGPIFVEEPESGIFPSSQYDLVRLFAWLSNQSRLNVSFALTTHSPYVLSSFNNLVEAGQVVRDHPELRNEVAKLIPEQYWIKDGDLRAYSIHDGVLESILSESGLIDGEYLDGVSETIGDEFDKLLRLEYDHSEAP